MAEETSESVKKETSGLSDFRKWNLQSWKRSVPSAAGDEATTMAARCALELTLIGFSLSKHGAKGEGSGGCPSEPLTRKGLFGNYETLDIV